MKHLLLASALLLALLGVLAASTPPPSIEASDGGPPADTSARPLRHLMVALAQDVARIDQGIWHEDYVLIEQGSRDIAGHPRIAAEQVAAIQQALGDRFEAFVQYDKTVHRTATRLAEAAAAEDMAQVLEHYGAMQRSCVGCHTTFRQEVRAALWEAGER